MADWVAAAVARLKKNVGTQYVFSVLNQFLVTATLGIKLDKTYPAHPCLSSDAAGGFFNNKVGGYHQAHRQSSRCTLSGKAPGQELSDNYMTSNKKMLN